MSATIVVLALLTLAGFLFWLAVRAESIVVGFFAVAVLAYAVSGASGVLS